MERRGRGEQQPTTMRRLTRDRTAYAFCEQCSQKTSSGGVAAHGDQGFTAAAECRRLPEAGPLQWPFTAARKGGA